MATSYGSITIVDITDIGEFSVYPTANNPRTQIYSPDHTSGSGYMPDWSSTNLLITPVAYYASQNVSTTATYTWKRRDGAGNVVDLTADETVINFPDTQHPGVLQVSNNVLGNSTSGIISYIVTAHYTVDNVPLEAVGEIDFSLTRQGSVAKTATITGESIFKYNSAGQLLPDNNKTITLNGKVAGVSITTWQYKNTNGWATYPNSTTGSSSLVVRPTDSVFNNDSVTIRLNTNDNTVYDLFTITKLYDGVKGDSVNSAVLSNEDQMLPADKNGKVTSYSGAETTLTIREGTQDVTNSWYITKTYSPTSLSTLDSAANDYEVDFTGISVSDTTFNNIDTAYVLFECRKTSTGAVEFSRKFSLVKVKTGQDGETPTIYSLQVSALAVNTEPANGGVHPNPNPTQVVFNAYQQTGNALPTAYDGRIQFYINDSSTISVPVTTNTSTRTINFTDSPWNADTVKSVKAVLYEAGANTKQLDSQTVVIVNDGSKGTDGAPGATGFGAVNVIIGNEADVIPCNSSNHPLSQFTIDIPYEGYQGTTLKTTSVNAPSLPASDFGRVIAADTSTAGHVKYVIKTTDTLSAGGQVTLTFTVNCKDYDANGAVIDKTVSISKIYTWTRSSAAVNGQNAIVLQVATPNGTVIVNGDGTLYARAILSNGAGEASGETYTWSQFKNGAYIPISSSTTPGVETGHLNSITWTSGDNGSADNVSDYIKITPTAVEGYASFQVVSNYKSKSYTQYISVIDKTDPVQVSLHSTVGTQIKNSQGQGCVYARVVRSDKELDIVPQNIEAGTSTPESGMTNGDYFVLLSNDSTVTNRTARLYKYNGTIWVDINTIPAEKRVGKYTWTFRNSDNTPITTGVPYQDTVDRTQNQFIYIDASLINQKITIDCQVEI